jgi:peptidyl-prolyl cis-trans isomerase C
MKKYVVWGAMVVFLTLASAGCDYLQLPGMKKAPPKAEVVAEQPTAVTGTPIAKVNNLSITLEDLNQEVDAVNVMVSPERPEDKIDTRDKKIKFLKDVLVQRALLYQYALDHGLDKKENVVRALERGKQAILVAAVSEEEATKIDVTSAEIQSYYDQYKEQFKNPEERHILEILVSTESEAKDVLIELLKGADFATLAQQRSKAPSAANGGDLGFIKPGVRSPQYDAVAFSNNLDTGDYSNIFKTPEGCYVLKIEGKKGGQQQQLADIRENLKNLLKYVKYQKRVEDLIGNLSREAKIEIYEGAVK